MLLAVDVGNTNIVLGVFNEEHLAASWRVSTNRRQTGDEYGVLFRSLISQSGINDTRISGMIVSSVVPPLMTPLAEAGRRYFGLEPLFVGPGVKTGLNILTENPREVGADRIVNAVAGIALYGTPLIIVDFGTATTFDAISERGEYLGGAIAPGIHISTEALFQHAAKLQRVDLVKPKRVIGRDTVSSMQSGIIYGFVGQVDGVVKRMAREFVQKPKIIATGGLAHLIAGESETLETVNPLLTLEGLKIIYRRNHN